MKSPHHAAGPASLPLAALLLVVSAAFAQAQTPWWQQTDQDFANNNASGLITGKPEDQVRVAWMLFARVSQPVPYDQGQITTWENWASDTDTFDPQQGKSFRAVGKVRTRPHLQFSKISHLAGLTGTADASHPGKNIASEEVTRNTASYDYITKNSLNSKSGIGTFLQAGNTIQFPIGTIEVKASWIAADKTPPGVSYADAYTFSSAKYGTWYLAGLHIMAKFFPTPKDTFTSPQPSWLWTTFEFKNNPGLKNARGLLNNPTTSVTPGDLTALLAESGITKTFPNLAQSYLCNGTQISFTDGKDAKGNPKPVLLGNTQLEVFAFTPASAPSPAKWKTWQISCHTCHGAASLQTTPSFNFNGVGFNNGLLPDGKTPNIGPIDPSAVKGYPIPMDFNWALSFAQ